MIQNNDYTIFKVENIKYKFDCFKYLAISNINKLHDLKIKKRDFDN